MYLYLCMWINLYNNNIKVNLYLKFGSTPLAISLLIWLCPSKIACCSVLSDPIKRRHFTYFVLKKYIFSIYQVCKSQDRWEIASSICSKYYPLLPDHLFGNSHTPKKRCCNRSYSAYFLWFLDHWYGKDHHISK